MAKHRTSGGANSVTNEINTLKDGVGRQAPSKRMPTEAEEIINCQVTLEQSVQKRPGMEAVLNVNNLTWDGEYDGETTPEIPAGGVYSVSGVDERINDLFNADAKYIWFELSSDNLFLIQILLSDETWETAVANNQEIIKIIKVNDDGTWTLDYTITAGSGDITGNVYNYLMYGTQDYNGRIKYVNAGADILLLNSEVYAGFSSSFNTSNNKWCLHSLSGQLTLVEDIKGRKISYYPAGARDPESESRIYQIDSFYFRGDRIWTPIGTDSENGVLTRWGGVFQAIEDRDTTVGGERPQIIQLPTGTGPGNYFPPIFSGPGADPYGDGGGQVYTRNGWKLLRYVKEIEAEYNTNVEELNNYPVGVAVNSFRDLPFPPRIGEVKDRNFIWWYEYPGPFSLETLEAADTLAVLYDGWDGVTRQTNPDFNTNEPLGGNKILGRGGIFYCKNAFLEALPGWYRAVDTETAPYYQRVRSPYPYGRFDERRMPQKLSRQSDGSWKVEPVNWDMRLAGTDEDNPGPTAFRNGRQTPIRDIAIFQNRLYLAADDTVFASRLGEYEDFWIADPGNITDSDPIDTTLSTNSYAEVEYMIPFRDQLFIVTNASTQFILTGFDNVVSPFTVEIQPISFYTTSGVTNPVAVGNNVYFANNKRMYMYYPQNVEAGMTVEMSKHCPDYLPEKPTGLYVATANDTMFISSENDPDNDTYPHELYCYVNRYSGNQMVQSAFHKWVLDSPDFSETNFSKNQLSIKSAYTKGNYLYVVYFMDSDRNDGFYGTYLGRIFLNTADESVPRLDHYFKYTQTGSPSNIYYTVPEVEVGASGYTLFNNETEFTAQAGSFTFEEGFNFGYGGLVDPVEQGFEFLSGISIETQVYVDPNFIQEYPAMSISPSGPESASQSINHLRIYGGNQLTVPNRTYAIRFKLPFKSSSLGFYLSGYNGPTGAAFVKLYNEGSLVSQAPVSVLSGVVNPPQFYGIIFPYVNGVAVEFDTAEIFIPPNPGSTEFDVVGIDKIIFGGGPGLSFMNDEQGFIDSVGPLFLYEDFESYPFGLVDSPTTFSNSNITIESIMVDNTGNPVVPTTSITGPTVFTVPSNGSKHYANYGPVNLNTWTLSVKLPAPTNNFACYLSGSSRPYIEARLINNNVQQTILTLGPFGEQYGPAEFIGFITPGINFDEVRFTIPPIPGSGSFDSIGIDEIRTSYSPEFSTGLTWFCVPYGVGGLDTVWLGSGWGSDSYKALPIVATLGRVNLNKPSWVAVQGNYSAPLANVADTEVDYIVNNLSDLDEFQNVQTDDLALILSENTVYRYVGAWVLNNVRTWVDYSSGQEVQLSAEIAFGRRYLMDIELSQQFIRDQQNNVIEGVLSLRQLILRHKDTAEYAVQVYSQNDRLRSFTEFKEPYGAVSKPNLLKVPLDTSGELVAKILGFSETTKIKITSDSVLPVNLTNMTIRGKFRRKNSTFLS